MFTARMVLHMERTLRCSFCGRSPTPERKLIAGPTPDVAICKECVDLCVEIFEEEGHEIEEPESPPPTPRTPRPWVEIITRQPSDRGDDSSG
jgi:hypothetical protein